MSKTIEGEVAANYLLDIIKSVLGGGGGKPIPPWRNNIINAKGCVVKIIE